MWLVKQFADIFRAPAALFKLSGRAVGLLVLYLVLAAILLAAVGGLLVSHQDNLRALITAYLLPDGWRFAGDLLIKHFLASQTKEVLINASASGTLVLVSLLLFPVKERLSLAFERDAELTDDPIDEHPLWFQGLEELKLVLLYVTVFMLVFWIGYHPDPTRKLVATGISYGFLFFSFAIDFISPLLQRHKSRYSQIIKVLLKHPFAAVGFGAMFAAPSVLVGLHLKKTPDTELLTAVVLLFSVNVVAIVWAAVAGTWLAAQLLDSAKQTRRSSGPLRAAAWLALLAVFAYNSYIFGALGVSLHHKSQILKCNYSVDLETFGFDLPKVKPSVKGITGLLKSAWSTVVKGEPVSVGAHMNVRIDNPTDFDVGLEKNRIDIEHDETVIANTQLSPLSVPARRTVDQRVDFKLKLHPQALAKGLELLKNRWKVTLYLMIARDFEFPVYLLTPDSAGTEGSAQQKKKP